MCGGLLLIWHSAHVNAESIAVWCAGQRRMRGAHGAAGAGIWVLVKVCVWAWEKVWVWVRVWEGPWAWAWVWVKVRRQIKVS